MLSRFIFVRKGFQPAPVSHTRRNAGAKWWRFRADLLWPEGHANHAAADSEHRAFLQHRRVGSFAIKKCAIRRIEVLQTHIALPHLDDTVVAGNLRVVQRNIGSLAADYRARLAQ